MRRLIPIVLLAQLVLSRAALCDERHHQQVVIDDPFIELHTGPGRGYPVFYIAERGEQIQLLKEKTDWYKVEVERGKEGWVYRDQLKTTLKLDGEPYDVPGLDFADYAKRRWESGIMYGSFGGADAISAYGSFNLTQNLAAELTLTQVLGPYSDASVATLDVVHILFPEWHVTPFFSLGGGSIHTVPKATLVATTDRTDPLAHVGFGVRTYLTKRFIFRAEYKTYVVFTKRNDNEEIREWKAGLSFFF
jgi:uncharacterized protein YgiM (DUF1202 family)